MIEAVETSIPTDEVNKEESVMVKRPEPEYASIKYLMDGRSVELVEGGRM
jgi:hypothetical protein